MSDYVTVQTTHLTLAETYLLANTHTLQVNWQLPGANSIIMLHRVQDEDPIASLAGHESIMIGQKVLSFVVR